MCYNDIKEINIKNRSTKDMNKRIQKRINK